MAHIHEDSDTYYLDQLCLVALSGAFGVICLVLFFWCRLPDPSDPNRIPMLKLMLGDQFHPFVLASGILLVGLTLIRAATLWKSAGGHAHDHAHEHTHEHGQECAHDHDHGHDHHHDHDHAHCDHDHGGEHQHQHEHGEQTHTHAVAHSHSHSHDHDDHDHDWAPWRYVVLLVPLILFLLGLPNKMPQIHGSMAQVDTTRDAIAYAALVSATTDPSLDLALGAALMLDESKEVVPITFKELESLAYTPESRKQSRGMKVLVKGQYSPNPQNNRQFGLVRFKIRCCAADAVPLNVAMVSKESITDIKPAHWVNVTGTVEFYKQGNNYATVLRVAGRDAVKETTPDQNPWIQ